MRPSMSKGIVGELEDEMTWGKAKARSGRDSCQERLLLPKVTLWAEEEYRHSSTPYFIKVIGKTSDFRNHVRSHGCRLTIPAAFTRDYFQKMDREVILEDAVDGRSTWKVLFRAEGYRDWTRGWPEFSQQNNLQCGNVIVFALVSHSRFVFTLFNDQGCQIIHPSRAMQENKLGSEEKPILPQVKCEENKVSSQWHSPSCPKHYPRTVQPKLEIQEDGENIVSHVVNRSDDFPVGYSGHDKSCQASPQNVDLDKACQAAPQNIGLDEACQATLNHKLKQVKPKRKFNAFANSAQNNHHICIHVGFSCGLHHHEEKPEIRPLNQTLDQSEDSNVLLEQCQKGIEQIQIAESDHQPKEAHLNPILFKFTSKRSVVTKAAKREARLAARRYSRTLRRLSSIAVMKEDHVYKEFFIELPRTLLRLGDVVEFPQPPLTLVDSTGRSWEIQWYASGRHRLALIPKDWAQFAVHHLLEEGDALVFETTDVEARIILVRIFRVVDIPDNLGTDVIYTHYSVESAF